MKNIPIALVAALALSFSAWGKAPPGSTGECKDGTYTTSATKEGACSSHGGVKTWLAKEDKKDEKGKAEKPGKADTPAKAEKPANATGECKDGTFTTSETKSGACAGHKGVKNWFGKEEAKKTEPPKHEPAPAKGSGPAMPPPAKGAGTATPPASERPAAAGGGAGKVWVNTESKVYHCEKDALYGKTKQGEYMTEAQAKASGARAARGKECS